MNWDDIETFTRKPRTRKKKKKRDFDAEELDFRLLVEEIEVVGSGHDVIEQMENKLRKIKREEEN